MVSVETAQSFRKRPGIAYLPAFANEGEFLDFNMKAAYFRLVFPVGLFLYSMMFILLPWTVVDVQVSFAGLSSTQRQTFQFPLWERLDTNVCYHRIVSDKGGVAGQSLVFLQAVGWGALLVQIVLWVILWRVHWNQMMDFFHLVGTALVVCCVLAVAWALLSSTDVSGGFECIFTPKASVGGMGIFGPSGLIVFCNLALTIMGIVLRSSKEKQASMKSSGGKPAAGS